MRLPDTTTVVALLAVLVAAVYIGNDRADRPVAPNSVQVMDRAGMLGEYRALADDYPWPLPAGISFPATLPEPPEPTVYEVGEGGNQADSFWICAWMGEWLAVRLTDAAEAATAWAWLQRAEETRLHREHYDDPRDVWHHEILEPAGRGEVASLREFYATSCRYAGLATAETLDRGRH